MESLIGICLAIMSGVTGTLGKQLIGLSARIANTWRAKCLFVLGMFLATVLGALLNAAAYGFAAQSLIAPFNGLEIALNILIAPCILHERLTLPHVIGTVFVAAGAVLTAVFGPHTEESISWEQMQEKFFRVNVLIYAAVFFAGLALCRVFMKPSKHFGANARRSRGIALAVAAGAVAGNVCFIKCSVSLIRFSLRGDLSPWSHWLSYVLVACAITVAFSSVKLMVKGLQEFEAIFIITLFGGSNIVMACVSGDVVMTELDGHSIVGKLKYWSSVLAIMVGLLIINLAFESDSPASDGIPEIPDFIEEESWGEMGRQFSTMADVVSSNKRAPVVWANLWVGVAVAESRKFHRAMTCPGGPRRQTTQQLTTGVRFLPSTTL